MESNLFPKVLTFFLFFCMRSSVLGEAFTDRSVLLELKTLVSDPLGMLSSWTSNGTNHCSWFGVSCDANSRVISLNISGGGDGYGGNSDALSCSKSLMFPFIRFGIERNCSMSDGKLVGKLSPLIGKLSELIVLSLPFNELVGEIPVELWGLEKLEVIDFEGNLFTGSLPNRVVGLNRLRVLNLGFNRLDGEIPTSLSKCLELEVLNLDGNKLIGSVPGFLSRFLKLRGIYLGDNELNGTITDVFGSNCQYLEHLDLSGNFLVGGIPESLGNCRHLRTLLLFSNLLTGVIPRDLGWLRHLQILDVSGNFIIGAIPAELGNCVELSVVVLSNLYETWPKKSNAGENALTGGASVANDDHNHFQGSIPTEITTLPKLRVLWAPRAILGGKLPSDWADCKNLEMVNLAGNNFIGEITGVFERCKKLYYLDLSSNMLNGTLDEKLPVPCMTVFDISQNLISGSIPIFNYRDCPVVSPTSGLVQSHDPFLAYLSFFASNTRITSHLPFSIANLAIIHNFSGNNFSGSIRWLPVATERLGKQTDYAFLAGKNELTGQFTGGLFGKCGNLHGILINVNNNKLSGPLPLKLGVMCRSLRFFDASENQISGSIPTSLGDLKSLASLDLSGNKLQGQIPANLFGLKNLKFISLAGNNLTGRIPSSFGHLHSLEVLNLSSNSLSGEIPQGLVHLGNLTALLLDRNKLTGKIPAGFLDATSLSTLNVSFNNLTGTLPPNGKVINCSSALGNHFLNSCTTYPLSVSSPALTDSDVEQNTAQTSEKHGLNSIEIASIASAAAVVSVLAALIILFIYSRKMIPDARVQVSEPKEIKVFVDIGVPLLYENIVEATGNFHASNCIGNGGFGATYKAEIAPGNLVAIKRLSAGRFHGAQQFHAEIKALGRVQHPNLVTLIGYHASEAEMFLIYNYFPGGNLADFIKKRSTESGCWKILHKISLDIANALAYLHDQCAPRVLHRDVKPSNILLDDNLNAYLSDFGLARILGTSETHATTGVAGTFGYVAPEYALTCRVSEKADVYSYGVVLLELISDKKVLDPSFSSHGDGFNIVSWACLLLRHGQAKEVFTVRLWDTGPHDDLVEMLHLAVTCTVDTLSTRPSMKQVVRSLKQIQPS